MPSATRSRAQVASAYDAGRRSRRALLDAVLRVVAQEGVSAATHRRVNAEAGVAHGLTTYYFANKHEMLCEAYEHWIEGRLESARAFATGLASAETLGERRARAIEALVESAAEELESGAAAAGFALAREPSLAGRFGSWETRLLEVFEAECAALGSRSPEQDAWLMLSAIRGLQLAHLSAGGRAPDRAGLHATLGRLVDALTALDATKEQA